MSKHCAVCKHYPLSLVIMFLWKAYQLAGIHCSVAVCLWERQSVSFFKVLQGRRMKSLWQAGPALPAAWAGKSTGAGASRVLLLAGSVQFQKKKISCKEGFEEAFSSFGEAGASAWSKLVNGQGFCALATPMSCYYPVIGRNLISWNWRIGVQAGVWVCPTGRSVGWNRSSVWLWVDVKAADLQVLEGEAPAHPWAAVLV